MKNKIFYPLMVHILLCIVCFIVFMLTWMGPEAGLIFQYFPDINGQFIFILSAVFQVIVILIYFHVGKNICSFSPRSLFAIISVSIANILNIIIVYCFYHNIAAALEFFLGFGGGTPFFFIYLMGHFFVVIKIIIVIAPSLIMFAGNVYGYLKSRTKHNNNDGVAL